MRSIAIAAIAIAISSGAAAQNQSETLKPASPWQFFGSFGYNFGDGSEELVKGNYANNAGTYSIKAGNGLAVAAGVSYSITDKADIQFSLGHERTSTSGSNGDFTFTRVPVELLGFYNLGDHWRVGGGLRLATSARLESYGVVSGVGNYDFTPRPGYVLEAQYLTKRHANPMGRFGVAFKLVDETFEYAPTNYTAKGHHLGVSLIYYR
ncbi:hypothetical protein [Rhodoferax mekongensis]|uniref:Outer membrane protein beta-barrel domain-containing protein n=1 Tax=Rhodoferax mekongensis TaxID=3068341 RepID=A0ABZ0B0J0_9BURK|nr:hypothetical protein [Rhodoferax sp. TBRC 17307]WNO05230.1 hypothetical protein RAN89_02065 [Rhodoferax sp. TBRC 17307]